MEITPRDKKAIVYGAVVLGVLAAYLLIIEPVIGAYDDVVSNHQARAAQMAKILRDNNKAGYLTGQIKAWEEKNGAQTAPKRYSEQITAVSDRIMTAGQCGVTIKNSSWIAPKPWPDDPRLQMAQVQLDAEGGWEQICTFLANLYRVDGVLSVEQMDLSAAGRRDGRASVKLTLSVLVEAETQVKERTRR